MWRPQARRIYMVHKCVCIYIELKENINETSSRFQHLYGKFNTSPAIEL